MSSFLNLNGKTIVVLGVANRKSVAWHIARELETFGARVVYSVRSEARRQSLLTALAGKPVFVCDVEEEGAADRLATRLAQKADARVQGKALNKRLDEKYGKH